MGAQGHLETGDTEVLGTPRQCGHNGVPKDIWGHSGIPGQWGHPGCLRTSVSRGRWGTLGAVQGTQDDHGVGTSRDIPGAGTPGDGGQWDAQGHPGMPGHAQNHLRSGGTMSPGTGDGLKVAPGLGTGDGGDAPGLSLRVLPPQFRACIMETVCGKPMSDDSDISSSAQRTEVSSVSSSQVSPS